MAKVNKITAAALAEIMPAKEVAKLSGLSTSQVNKIKSGVHPAGKLDKTFLAKQGLKICTCCDERLVPTKPVRYQILTRLCEKCWSSSFATDDYAVDLSGDLSFEVTIGAYRLEEERFEDEIFKTIEDFPAYLISNYGRCYSMDQNNFVKLRVTMNRTLMVVLSTDDGEVFGRLVHFLVLEAFVGPCPEGHEFGRKNTVLSDNQLKNLEWKEPAHA